MNSQQDLLIHLFVICLSPPECKHHECRDLVRSRYPINIDKMNEPLGELRRSDYEAIRLPHCTPHRKTAGLWGSLVLGYTPNLSRIIIFHFSPPI